MAICDFIVRWRLWRCWMTWWLLTWKWFRSKGQWTTSRLKKSIINHWSIYSKNILLILYDLFTFFKTSLPLLILLKFTIAVNKGLLLFWSSSGAATANANNSTVEKIKIWSFIFASKGDNRRNAKLILNSNWKSCSFKTPKKSRKM